MYVCECVCCCWCCVCCWLFVVGWLVVVVGLFVVGWLVVVVDAVPTFRRTPCFVGVLHSSKVPQHYQFHVWMNMCTCVRMYGHSRYQCVRTCISDFCLPPPSAADVHHSGHQRHGGRRGADVLRLRVALCLPGLLRQPGGGSRLPQTRLRKLPSSPEGCARADILQLLRHRDGPQLHWKRSVLDKMPLSSGRLPRLTDQLCLRALQQDLNTSR